MSARARLLIAVVCALALAVFTSAPAFASNGNPSPPGQEKQPSDTAQPSSTPSTDQVDTTPSASAPNENGNGNGNNGNGLGNGGGNGNNGNGGNSANAHANAAQKDPSNTSSIARVDQPGANGGVGQENDAQAAADAAAANNAGWAQATADAVATQDSPTNVNISARVNSPGDDGPTSQTNSSGANANAAATGTPDSQAQADATAAQQSPLNVNVSVRVNSPGNQGPVAQSNAAHAAAGETPSAPADGPQSAGDTNSASIDNSAKLGQSLEQCGAQCSAGADETTVSSASPPTVEAPTTTTAAAIQQAPTNVNVSVRLASPGSDGAVSQASTANATADHATVTSSDPTNVNIQVTVAGDTGNIAASSNGLPWTWSWDWDLGAAPSDAGTATNDWNWDWTPPATDATSTPSPGNATTAPQPAEGQWVWIFDYTAPDGTHVSLISSQPCACAWVWSWTWSGAPAAGAPPASAAASAESASDPGPQIVQSNAAVATANASASTDLEQQTRQNAPELQGAGQQTDLIQSADADSVVDQTGAGNSSVITAGRPSSLEQWNLVSASSTSTAEFTAKQAISQSLQLTAGDVADHRESASQQITIVQTASAAARAAQAGAHNRTKIGARGHSEAPIGAITQSNTANVWTLAGSRAAVVQQVTQHQLGEGADQVALAGQDATLIQDAEADAEVAQANLGNTNSVLIPAGGIFNPPISQSNDVHASAQMTNGAVVEQDIAQSESGAFITWSATAEQAATVVQSGDASASADQAGIENLAGWTGPIATPFSAHSSDGAIVAAPLSRLIRSDAPRGSGRAVLPVGRTMPVATPAALPPARGAVALSAPTRDRGGTASSSSAAVALRHVIAPAVSAPRAAAVDIGDCAPFCRGGLSGGIAGLAIGVSGAWYALQPRSFKLAAPGVGRLLDDAPALGRSVDIAPFERPG